MRSIIALCVVALLGVVSCHSWIDCTDYSEVTKANGNYNANSCKSRPRNWKNHNGGGVFGADTGYNFQGNTPDQCLYPLKAGVDVSSFYTTQYPMATYRLGQKVCLAWPAKNHAASRVCTNQYIPDTSNRIYISGANPTADPTSWTLLEDWGANPKGVAIEDNGGGQGFQNCPNFCAGTDKALCGRCFTLPSNLAPGRYAFQWRWVFNEGTAPYTSCWDADVVAGSGPAPAPAPPAPAPPAPGPGTSSTGTPATTQRPLTGDAVRIPNPPTNIQIGVTTIPLTVEYSASSPVDIVVDFMSADYKDWYGKAIQKNVAAGKGTLQMSITVEKNPPAGDKVIKPWIVVAGNAEASQGWAYELDNKQYITSFTNNPPQSQTPLSTVTPSAANKVVAATGFFTVVVLILSVFIIAV